MKGFEEDKEYKEYRREAEEKWGQDAVKASEERVRRAGPEKFKQAKEEGDAICRELADLMGQDPASKEVQQAVGKYYRHMHFFVKEIPLQMFRSWGRMYVTDIRFRKTYDKYKAGLADFLNEAIQIYCSESDVPA